MLKELQYTCISVTILINNKLNETCFKMKSSFQCTQIEIVVDCINVCKLRFNNKIKVVNCYVAYSK